MAWEAIEADKADVFEEEENTPVSNGKVGRGNENGDDDEGSEEEEEDEEPRLKYASLTKHLKTVYRNGDATSAFLVAGDKMVSRQVELKWHS